MTVESIILAIVQLPHGAVLMVPVDFNSGLVDLERNFRQEEIVVLMATACLEYISTQLLPVRKSWEGDRRTW